MKNKQKNTFIEEMVDMIEIWRPTKKGGEVYHFNKQEKLKKVALIINGYPIFLEKDFFMQIRQLTKEEADNLKNPTNQYEK